MKLEVEIKEENGWISSWQEEIKPKDKELCIIITEYGGRIPEIVQYRKTDHICDYEDGYFLNVAEAWRLIGYGDEKLEGYEPGFYHHNVVHAWKPLALPENINKELLEQIESWFEGDG